MEKVLVTGGSGFIGRSLIKELLKRYPHAQIISVSRSEGFISQLMVSCPSDRLKIVIADIRDLQAMRYISRRVDTVIHLAAMKRVDLSEEQCREAVSANVVGTMNILDAFKGDTFILMSTDKAVEPVNCYGATKLVAEKLVLEHANKDHSGSRFMIIRSGNVMGSTGSVLDIWQRQIQDNNEITVTDLDMLRFYTSVDGVVRLYIAVLERGENGKVYVTPRGEAVILREMVEKALKLYGNENTRVKFIGMRPGERMQEKMLGAQEVNVVSGFEETEMVPTPLAVSS
ncbi:MAG: polysaccharide biosynthesis protein [Dehalococcoidia bacterium]|nr:polysaccharide biosynthesis protein [Dehalococcoidia bacterium]